MSLINLLVDGEMLPEVQTGGDTTASWKWKNKTWWSSLLRVYRPHLSIIWKPSILLLMLT
jgi:hypothetical protein